MFEPVLRKYIKKGLMKEKEMKVINRAFNSLSFRGKRGYSSEYLLNKNVKREVIKNKTYGGILCIKSETGEEKYALVQGRYTGKWSFPKGHSNEGEYPIECTLREVGEETGIDELPEPIEYIQVGYGNYFIFNLEDMIELKPRDKNEIMNTRWVTLEEMDKMEVNADVSQFKKNMSR